MTKRKGKFPRSFTLIKKKIRSILRRIWIDYRMFIIALLVISRYVTSCHRSIWFDVGTPFYIQCIFLSLPLMMSTRCDETLGFYVFFVNLKLYSLLCAFLLHNCLQIVIFYFWGCHVFFLPPGHHRRSTIQISIITLDAAALKISANELPSHRWKSLIQEYCRLSRDHFPRTFPSSTSLDSPYLWSLDISFCALRSWLIGTFLLFRSSAGLLCRWFFASTISWAIFWMK